MKPLTLLASFLAIITQVICQEENNHYIEKRHVLARLGELPFIPGKRYIAALAKNGDITPFLRPTWGKKYQDSIEDLADEDSYEKRYIGSLARSGELRARNSEEKRSGVEGLVRGLATGEELKRLRLEALKEELYRERKEEQGYIDPDESRSESFGYISEDQASSDDEEEESPEKRGGISSLARSGYGFPKRTVDEEIEELMSEPYATEEKRNVASLARGSLFPMAFSYPKRFDEEKRNIPSLLRDRMTPLGEGKRHIGSLVRNYAMPYEDKRNLVSLAKNKDFPYIYMPGKRDSSSSESDSELSKRYVAALLRQGRLPVGEDASHQDDAKDISLTTDDSKEEINERKKKSIDEPVLKDGSRAKREALDDLFGAFGPVKDKTSDDWASPINKKYFGAKGGGKIPGGRLSTLGNGRRPGRRDNNGRRKGSM